MAYGASSRKIIDIAGKVRDAAYYHAHTINKVTDIISDTFGGGPLLTWQGAIGTIVKDKVIPYIGRFMNRPAYTRK